MFCFIELQNLKNSAKFNYQLKFEGTIVSDNFEFWSNILTSETPEICVFGDHDLGKVGMQTIEWMEADDFDIVIFLGDLAYNIADDNG